MHAKADLFTLYKLLANILRTFGHYVSGLLSSDHCEFQGSLNILCKEIMTVTVLEKTFHEMLARFPLCPHRFLHYYWSIMRSHRGSKITVDQHFGGE